MAALLMSLGWLRWRWVAGCVIAAMASALPLPTPDPCRAQVSIAHLHIRHRQQDTGLAPPRMFLLRLGSPCLTSRALRAAHHNCRAFSERPDQYSSIAPGPQASAGPSAAAAAAAETTAAAMVQTRRTAAAEVAELCRLERVISNLQASCSASPVAPPVG